MVQQNAPTHLGRGAGGVRAIGHDGVVCRIRSHNGEVSQPLRGRRERLLCIRRQLHREPHVPTSHHSPSLADAAATSGAEFAPVGGTDGTDRTDGTDGTTTTTTGSSGYGRRLLQRREYNVRMTDELITAEIMEIVGGAEALDSHDEIPYIDLDEPQTPTTAVL